jgi:putative addiction module CopG family antidote
MKAMEVEFTPEQQAFVRQAIENGRLGRPEEAVREALSLWEGRERARVELLLALDEAEADLQAGRYSDCTIETLPQLADELKREARSTRDSHQHS